MQGNSRSVTSNQPGVHDKLPELVQRYLQAENLKPIQQHTLDAFAQVQHWLAQQEQKSIILDSCCGIGESSWRLAAKFPDTLVVGVDKSLARVNKHGQQLEYNEYQQQTSVEPDDGSEAAVNNNVVFQQQDNYCVVRADVIDFWRLVQQHNWQVAQHYLLYPNPYPKSSQVQKRWHATASFKDILAIGGKLHVRSNWNIYIEEFALALKLAGKDANIDEIKGDQPFTPFERKYWNSGQRSWQVTCQL